MTFRVGQRVVCVDASPAKDGFVLPLVEGRIYTISRILPPNLVAGVGIDVAEAPANERLGFRPAYQARRFRPLIDTTKHVEAIKSLIAPIFKGKTVELVQ